MAHVLEQINDELATTLDGVERSLARVNAKMRGFGAGIVVHPDGLVLTNAHVVGRGPVTVTLHDDRTLPASILAIDDEHDLAALSVGANGLPSVELGDSTAAKPGQLVLALGHPWGVPGAVAAGVVIGTGDRHPESRPGRDWLVTDVRLRPGHSGGPMVDAQGRVVGINTMMAGPEVGLAVPVHVVKDFLRKAFREQSA